MNVLKAMNQGYILLSNAGIEVPRLEAGMLLGKVLGIKATEIYLNRERNISPRERLEFINLVEERVKGKPIHYLMGYREFMSLDFKVERGVLIPRPDTEVLVEYILDYEKIVENPVLKILEIGTGSGAIAVSLAKYLKNSRIWAGDIDKDAISLAKENARAHGVDSKIEFFEGDMFKPLEEMGDIPNFHIIVSNPPYIPTEEIDSLAPQVKDHEPLKALDGGVDGLNFYRILIQEAPFFLKDDGLWAVEVGYNQSRKVANLLKSDGRYKNIDFLKDLAGYERVVRAQIVKER